MNGITASVLALVLTAPAARAAIPAKELLAPAAPAAVGDAPVDNEHFLPGPDAAPPLAGFAGHLVLAGAEMRTLEPPEKRRVLGRDVLLFPSVRLSFVSAAGRLVPLERDVIRAGSLTADGSFWDVLISPGWIWSRPEDAAEDGAWSRAAFPFSLVSSLENETHHGLATFLYDGERVSALRYQVIQQTAPYLVARKLVAWGRLEARFEPAPEDAAAERARNAFTSEMADRLPRRPLGDLEVDAELLAAIDGPAADGVITSGFLVDGTLYLRPCRSPYGNLPDCAGIPFGIWSVTKTFGNGLALMRLAEKLGPGAYDEPLLPWLPADAVKAAGDVDQAWKKVRLKDALNMATGLGEGSATTEPNNPSDGYLVNYDAWYTEPGAAGKTREILHVPAHFWGPAEVFRYRDQDHFLLGAALHALAREKTDQDLLDLLRDEVLRPIGIHHAPWNRTLETEGRGVPLMAYGAYPSVDDLAKVARLLQDGGRHRDRQILHAGKVAEALYQTEKRGLPYGEKVDGRTYHMAFWHQPYRAAGGCVVDLAMMQGWGGHVVALFPNGVVGLRIGSGDPEDDRGSSVEAMAAVADRIRPFC